MELNETDKIRTINPQDKVVKPLRSNSKSNSCLVSVLYHSPFIQLQNYAWMHNSWHWTPSVIDSVGQLGYKISAPIGDRHFYRHFCGSIKICLAMELNQGKRIPT